MAIKTKLSWQAKIVAKIILSRLPIGYATWRRLGLFKHGHMELSSYAYSVFRNHFDQVTFPRKGGGFTALEIGPGDSLFSALIAYAFNASKTYLIDTGSYAQKTLQPYITMAESLKNEGLPTPAISNIQTLDDLLSRCNCTYGTEGLDSLQKIPDKSVDFIWSQAVLEHIRRREFLDLLRELRRIVRDDGVCSHRIDLRDHLGGGLNNLRFSERIWESDFMAGSGFYTNRFRYSEILDMFKKMHFKIGAVEKDRWETLPIPRKKLAAEFHTLSDEELLIYGFDVILHPA